MLTIKSNKKTFVLITITLFNSYDFNDFKKFVKMHFACAIKKLFNSLCTVSKRPTKTPSAMHSSQGRA